MAIVNTFANAPTREDALYTVDPDSVVGTPYTLVLHPWQDGESVPVDNARIVIAGRTGSLTPVTIQTDDPGRTILDPETFLPVTSATASLQGQAVEFIYRASVSQWYVKQRPNRKYLEYYQLTPVNDINGVTLDWTFQPFEPGDTALLVSYAAGVFTSNVNAVLNVKIVGRFSINATNNSFCDFGIAETFVGAGPNLLFDIAQNFSSSRVQTAVSNHSNEGFVATQVGDTFSFAGVSVQTGLTTDLLAGFVTFGVDE